MMKAAELTNSKTIKLDEILDASNSRSLKDQLLTNAKEVQTLLLDFQEVRFLSYEETFRCCTFLLLYTKNYYKTIQKYT